MFDAAGLAFVPSRQFDGALSRRWRIGRGGISAAASRSRRNCAGRWLTGFGIVTGKNERSERGYHRRDFEAAWKQYGLPPQRTVRTVQTVKQAVNVDSGSDGSDGSDGSLRDGTQHDPAPLDAPGDLPAGQLDDPPPAPPVAPLDAPADLPPGALSSAAGDGAPHPPIRRPPHPPIYPPLPAASGTSSAPLAGDGGAPLDILAGAAGRSRGPLPRRPPGYCKLCHVNRAMVPVPGSGLLICPPCRTSYNAIEGDTSLATLLADAEAAARRIMES